MTRKQALTLLALAPAGSVWAQRESSTGPLIQFNAPRSMVIALADDPDLSSINFFEVLYNGQSRIFSAKEVWEALNSPVKS
jgi:hypothetical protein